MRRHSSNSLALNLFMVSAAFIIAPAVQASGTRFNSAPPTGFEDLTSERQLVVDAYFGGAKLAEVPVTVSPGALRFNDPGSLGSLIPNVKSRGEVATALSGILETNAALACRAEAVARCGTLPLGQTGIIFDEERFRVDIFLSPTMLALADSPSDVYLDKPESGPALISRFGATLAGSSRGERSFHFQNRSIASMGALRLQMDSSVGSEAGLAFDNLTVQFDAAAKRLLGGIFWAPGSELLGRRKLIGAGVTTQLDTRIDKATLSGIPLSIFLQQPARVELLLDGNLVFSRIYSAGNRTLDTSNLPDGSYEILLRIHQDGQPVRVERRFFAKGSTMAPAGHPKLSAFVGFLQSRPDEISIQEDKLFYQASAAYRLSPVFGVDATLVGVQDKALIEAGAVFSTSFANVRLVGLATSSGDTGAAFRASTYGRAALSASFDLRAVNSRDGAALLPLSDSGKTFSEDPLFGATTGGSYVQATGIIDYRFRQASLRLSGFYRRDGGENSTYSFAASLEAPLVRRSRWDVRLQADLRKSDQDVSSFLGLRFLASGGAASLSGRSGMARRSGSSGKSTRFIGETQAGWNHQIGEESNLSTDLAFGRGEDGSYARGSGHFRAPFGNLRADAIQQFADAGDSTQLSLTADTAIVLGKGRLEIGARESSDSAALVSVSGAHPDQEFEILVDDVVRGTLRGSGSVPVFLPPYDEYELRLRPRTGSIRSFSEGSRRATLYPGNVVAVNWSVTPMFVFFGRLVDSEGRPIVDSDMRGPHGIGRTDENGYFQIEAPGGENIEVGTGGKACELTLPTGQAKEEFQSLGDMRCE